MWPFGVVESWSFRESNQTAGSYVRCQAPFHRWRQPYHWWTLENRLARWPQLEHVGASVLRWRDEDLPTRARRKRPRFGPLESRPHRQSKMAFTFAPFPWQPVDKNAILYQPIGYYWSRTMQILLGSSRAHGVGGHAGQFKSCRGLGRRHSHLSSIVQTCLASCSAWHLLLVTYPFRAQREKSRPRRLRDLSGLDSGQLFHWARESTRKYSNHLTTRDSSWFIGHETKATFARYACHLSKNILWNPERRRETNLFGPPDSDFFRCNSRIATKITSKLLFLIQPLRFRAD